MDLKKAVDNMLEGMDVTPVVRGSLPDVSSIDDRMGDILRSVKRLDMIRAGEYVGEMLVSVKDEISAVNAKKGMLELLGRWAKYEQPEVTNNNIQVNIVRTNAGENG